MKVNFEKLKQLFDPKEWDVGVLPEEHYDECMNSPIKAATHLYGINMTENPSRINISVNGKQIKSFLVLAKKSLRGSDYSLYEESNSILKKSGYSYAPVYLNFKKAVVLSGMGTVAKNSLVYNRKFGFQTKFCMYVLGEGVFENFEPIEVNRGLLNLCSDCDDCIKNCPVNAIHENWIHAKKCDEFIAFGNHDEISSYKWNWWNHIGKHRGEFTKEQVKEWSNGDNSHVVWDGDYSIESGIVYKNNSPIELDHCRRCQEQPKCSKMPIQN